MAAGGRREALRGADLKKDRKPKGHTLNTRGRRRPESRKRPQTYDGSIKDRRQRIGRRGDDFHELAPKKQENLHVLTTFS